MKKRWIPSLPIALVHKYILMVKLQCLHVPLTFVNTCLYGKTLNNALANQTKKLCANKFVSLIIGQVLSKFIWAYIKQDIVILEALITYRMKKNDVGPNHSYLGLDQPTVLHSWHLNKVMWKARKVILRDVIAKEKKNPLKLGTHFDKHFPWAFETWTWN